MTADQWKTAIGVILLVVFIIGVIAVANIFDSRSRRERGLPKRERGFRKKGKREKKS